MSAKFSKDDAYWLTANSKTGKLTEKEKKIVFSAFDETYISNPNDSDQVNNKKEITYLKKVCALKLATAIPEYFLLKLLFSNKHANNKKKITKLYFNFLANRISLEEFKKELHIAFKDGSVI